MTHVLGKGGERTLGDIITDIKQMLGASIYDDSFDVNIVIAINSALAVLSDIGISEADNVCLEIGDTVTWDELLEGRTDIEYIKSYIYLKVKMLFDPPSSSALLDAYNRQIAEFEWRLNTKQSVKKEE